MNLIAIATDVAVTLAGHWGMLADESAYTFLRLDDERGVWSAYGYLQLFAIAAMLVAVAHRRGEPALLYLAAAFLLTACDDMLSMHENFGTWLAGIGSSAGEPSILLGMAELGFLGFLGALVAALMALALLRVSKTSRPETLLLCCALLVVGLCATVLNFGEAATFSYSPMVGKAFSLMDDGGELMGSAAGLVLAAAMFMRPAHASTEHALGRRTRAAGDDAWKVHGRG